MRRPAIWFFDVLSALRDFLGGCFSVQDLLRVADAELLWISVLF